MNQRKRALHEAEALKRKLAESAASAIAQKNIQFALDHQHDTSGAAPLRWDTRRSGQR